MSLIAFSMPGAATEVKDSFLKKYNHIASKLERVNDDISELDQQLEFQTSSFKAVRDLSKKIYKRHKRIYKRLKDLSKHSKFLPFTALVSERASSTFSNFRENSNQSYRSIRRLNGSIDRQALLEEISSREAANQALLEELTTVAKSAAFGDPNSSGVFGIVSLVSGNCMPGPDINTDCVLETLITSVRVRNLTHYSESNGFVYYDFTEDPIAAIECDEDGSYSFDLEPGEYSIFVLDGDREYCNSFSAEGMACKLRVKDGMKAEFNSTIDHSFN